MLKKKDCSCLELSDVFIMFTNTGILTFMGLINFVKYEKKYYNLDARLRLIKCKLLKLTDCVFILIINVKMPINGKISTIEKVMHTV